MSLLSLDEFFADIPTLFTKHLRLRKITIEDAEDLFYYGSNAQVTRDVTWYPYETVEHAEDRKSVV